MNKKIFISYSQNDKNKVDSLSKALENSEKKFIPIIIANKRNPGKPLAEKVKEGILETTFFIPILTRSSISNQWVNQEIGFAVANDRNILPIVEKSILNELKGFIHNQIDIPFIFEGHKSNKWKEAQNYRKCYKELIKHLESESVIPKLKSSISPKKVRQGDKYTTKVHFIGNVKNAFFDNHVEHLESDFRRWNWDPNTLKDGGNSSPGELHGKVNIECEYSHITTNWPIGKYRINTRVYEHPIPGETGRFVIIENRHNLEIY